jgi:hypothetical protein
MGRFGKLDGYFGWHFQGAPTMPATCTFPLAPIASRAQHAAFVVRANGAVHLFDKRSLSISASTIDRDIGNVLLHI